MIFNSIDFAIFFPLVFILYWGVFNKKKTLRNIFLIAVSYFFYGMWDWRFLSLIIISSSTDFFIGKKIHTETLNSKRKLWLIMSLIINLGFLGFFKYFHFFIDSFTSTFALFGHNIEPYHIEIILPVGISFYTFQTLSYTIDIYNKKIAPTNKPFAFFAFVSFFPQLVAGPIERAKDLFPQFESLSKIDYKQLKSGLLLMFYGFFKKIMIADRLAIFVNNAYGDIENLDTISACTAIVFFAFQLYLDFSAYSDIAIGSSRMLGFNLSLNFRRPYLANSFSDFWKRWHISLSSWFKDYLYIPLGGNKVIRTRRITNILIVFMVSGLWHGPSWNFVIWGFINGLFILVFDSLLFQKNSTATKRVFNSLFISVSWALSLVFFRAETLQDAFQLFSSVFTLDTKSLYDFGLNEIEFKFTIKLLLAFIVYEIILENFADLYERFSNFHFIFRWAFFISVLVFIVFYGSYGVGLNDNNFIYFQF